MSTMARTVTLACALAAAGVALPADAQTATGRAPAAGEAAGSTAATAAAVATATRFLDRFEAGDFAAARADFSPEMAAALDAAKLATVSTQLAQAGPIAARSAPRVSQSEGHEVVVFTIERRAADVEATISVDGQGRVAGVYFL
ncbi:MAG TPA: DUF3887 domain-containing protein, partial [Luteimonas sp.]|nr:DUF3887 domain-containing protein [Luteimonas sp.]